MRAVKDGLDSSPGTHEGIGHLFVKRLERLMRDHPAIYDCLICEDEHPNPSLT
jgi:hypothetical protein